MNTKRAYLVNDDVAGHGGKTRLYRLDPPKTFGKIITDHILIKVQEPWLHVEPKAYVIPATPEGLVKGSEVKDYAGSHVCEGNPFMDPSHMEGTYWLALQLAGYELSE